MNELNQIINAVVSKMENNHLTLEEAKTIITNCEKKALAINVPVTIAVVDNGGNLIAQHKMDNAILASINISFSKAFTAISLKAPTHELAKDIQPNSHLYGLQHTNNNYCFLGGGFPIIKDSVVIGAIGVSGGTVKQDIEIATSVLSKDIFI